jgi:hypothetical protein
MPSCPTFAEEDLIAMTLKQSSNHNETLAGAEIKLTAEEMEEVIAPQITSNRVVIFAGNGLELGFEEIDLTVGQTKPPSS